MVHYLNVNFVRSPYFCLTFYKNMYLTKLWCFIKTFYFLIKFQGLTFNDASVSRTPEVRGRHVNTIVGRKLVNYRDRVASRDMMSTPCLMKICSLLKGCLRGNKHAYTLTSYRKYIFPINI